MLTTGLTGSQTERVTPDRTAASVGSGLLPVYATPAMIALMERTASELVAPFLREGEATVGTAIEVKHLAATPEGMEVRCQCVLTAIDRRRLSFAIEVMDAVGLVGTASHERFIVDTARFMDRAALRRGEAEQR
ncbi:MAG: thioesterase family protein [Myxococcaceae bacterium]|nr:thioesterase family protein [Myxococcaceae bacterium]